MNDVRKRPVLLYTLAFLCLFILAEAVLYALRLVFRKWVLFLFVVFFAAGTVVGIYQLLLQIRKTSLKTVLVTLFTVFLLAAGSVAGPVFLFAFASEEHVVERDGVKYVAHVNGFLHTYVYYHEYKNFLVEERITRIVEDYGKGGFDPIGNPYGHEYTVQGTTLYDESGGQIPMALS